MIKKELVLSKDEYFEVHLNLINAIARLKMTPREMEILACFMSLEGDITRDRLGTSGRKIVKAKLGLSDGGLGNFLKPLRKKKCIIEVNGVEQIHPMFFPEENLQEYQFKIRYT